MADEDDADIPGELLKKLADSALSKASDSAVGWVVDSIFGSGSSSGGDSQELATQIAAQQVLLTKLSDQITALATSLTQFEQASFTEQEQTDYDGLVAALAPDIANLQSMSQSLSAMQQSSIGSTLDGDQKTALANMRTQLPTLIDHINQIANPSTPGARGAIEVWGSVAFRKQSFFDQNLSLTNSIYVSDYLDPAFNQVSYLEALLVQALNLMAEAYHVSFDYEGETYSADTATVQTYAQTAQAYATAWQKIPAGGLGRLPNTVLADTRNKLLWTRGWVEVPGGPSPASCWTENCGGPVADGLSLTQAALPTYVSTFTLNSDSGWRIPTDADWTALLTGVNGADLYAWLTAQGVQPMRNFNVQGASLGSPLWSSGAGSTPTLLQLNVPTEGTTSFASANQCPGVTGDGNCPALAFLMKALP